MKRTIIAVNRLGGPSLTGAKEGKEYSHMAWTKPEFKVVAVTLEVTAYSGKK